MSTRAKVSKAVGSVIDGRFRDLQEQRDLSFPVRPHPWLPTYLLDPQLSPDGKPKIFARDVGTAPPAELLKVVAVNVPVELQTAEQDLTIHPGDYLIGDINGVVVLPQDLAEAALPLMAKQVAADSAMAEAIARGMSFTEASKKFRS